MTISQVNWQLFDDCIRDIPSDRGHVLINCNTAVANGPLPNHLQRNVGTIGVKITLINLRRTPNEEKKLVNMHPL
jgi:hypothetical protein